MAGKDKSVYICTAWETDLNKWVFQPDSILIPVEFQRNSYGFHWNSTGMTGFLQDSSEIPVDSCGFHRNSTGMTGFLQDSCRNRWGTIKYCWQQEARHDAKTCEQKDSPIKQNPFLNFLYLNRVFPRCKRLDGRKLRMSSNVIPSKKFVGISAGISLRLSMLPWHFWFWDDSQWDLWVPLWGYPCTHCGWQQPHWKKGLIWAM